MKRLPKKVENQLEGLFDLDGNSARVRLKKRSICQGLITQTYLAQELHLSMVTMHRYSVDGITTKAGKQGYSIQDAIRNVCAIARFHMERHKTAQSGSGDKSRKEKAIADIKEMEHGKMMKTLCLRADYLGNYADAVAQGVQAISGLSSLTLAQKKSVFTALRSVKLADLDEEY